MTTTGVAGSAYRVAARRADARAWCAAAVGLTAATYTVAMLAFAQICAAYDRVTFAHHAALIRRFVPRWIPAYILPFAALLCDDPLGSPLGWGRGAELVEVAACAVLVEVYGVCMRREAWIAAFEPELIDDAARPLGGAPRHPEDRRLHHLLRVQLLYGLPAVVTGLWVGTGDGWAACSASTLFFVKYVTDAGIGYEVVFHWDLHGRVLDLLDRPALGATWRRVAEWILGPVFGYVPRVDAVDHLLVHHRENSGREDTHTLLGSDRASFVEFSVFAVRMTTGLVTASALLRKRNLGYRPRMQVVAGLAFYWALIALTVTEHRLAGWWLLSSALLRGFVAARSQLTWHGLVDVTRARNPLGGTILWMTPSQLFEVSAGALGNPTADTGRTNPTTRADWPFLDNYHLTHHLHPRAHFSELPDLMRRDVRRVIEGSASLLDLAGLPGFALSCWAGDHVAIAAYLMLDMPEIDRAEFVRRRLSPDASCRAWIGHAWAVPGFRNVERRIVTVAKVLARAG